MKRHRSAVLVSAAVLLLACDSTSPAPNLDGVWGGLINMPATTDTLTLALGEQGGQIRGFGLQHALYDARFPVIYSVAGSITGRSVELSLYGGFASLILRGELHGSTLALFRGDEPVTLHLATSRGDGVAGTWGLVSTSGPTSVVRDTIEVLPDGRGRRHRENPSSSYGTLTMWVRRGGWLVLEQYVPPFFGSSVPFRDSLQIQSNALVRTTRYFDGSTATETYARRPQP